MRKSRPNYLTHNQKRMVLDECARRDREHITWTLDDIAEWARDSMKLSFKPSLSTISRITSKKNTVLGLGNTGDRMKVASLRNEALDIAISEWVNDMYAQRKHVSGDLIKEKGKHLVEQVNKALPDTEKVVLKFSNGWLYKFQKHHGYKSFKSHGESGDADTCAIERDLPHIRQKLAQYAINDVWNADEFGLFFKMVPDKTIAKSQLMGRKKEKARLTYLACANGDGTEKFPLCVIGKSCKPRAFEKKTGQELGFDYHYNKKAWMTSVLFFAWLKRLDDYIGATNGRKVALLIDNCSAHGKAHTIPSLNNVEVIFLPPNTTSVIQPMDAGVIAALKSRYRKKQLERALELNEAHELDIYKVDQLTAMKWMRDIWENLNSEIIFNCWVHVKIIDQILGGQGVQENIDRSDEVATTRTELSALMNEVVDSRTCMTVDELLNPVGENECTADVTDDYLVESILNSCNISTDAASNEADGSEDDIISLPSIDEQLMHLSIVVRMYESHNMATPAMQRSFTNMQNALRQAKKQYKVQTSILDFWRC